MPIKNSGFHKRFRPKTKKILVVQGNYGYGWSDLTYPLSREEAWKDKKEYVANELRAGHRIITRRVPRDSKGRK